MDKDVGYPRQRVKSTGKDQTDEPDKEKTELKPYIGPYEEAPYFNKSIIYIRTGYRINYHTPKLVFLSLFKIHNETFNIWSHLFGVFLYIYFAYLIYYWFIPYSSEKSTQNSIMHDFNMKIIDILQIPVNVNTGHYTNFPKWPLYLQIIGTVICFLFSSTFHLVRCHSNKVFWLGYKLD